MDLEEHSLEQIGDHCEVCGVALTKPEIEVALESGGPALCTVHAGAATAAEARALIDERLALVRRWIHNWTHDRMRTNTP